MMRRAPLLLLATISLLYFGAAIADAAFPDYIPIRPYSTHFIYVGTQALKTTQFQNSITTDLFGIAIVILFVSTLLVQIANRTTGITIAHSGFNPNPNLTSSIGVPTLLQLVPFLFVGALVFGILNVMNRHTPKGGF